VQLRAVPCGAGSRKTASSRRTDLVKVDAEQFEGDADVVAEGEGLEHVDDVVPVVDVLLAQMLQDADLLLRLSMKPLLVANDLQRHVHVVAVVLRLHHLTETAASQTLNSSQTAKLADFAAAARNARCLLADIYH